MNAPTKIRCAIYTRKSSEEGLEQAFNTLDAQYDAAAAYVLSQRHEGWKLVAERYDDGGISGGTMNRPALQRLLQEIDAGRIDMVVVYKIDRLTRSLADFAKLVERFETVGCSFVSVTQAFNTSTSMGRLTLNVLLSFAQFEREVTAERIRDKIAASKRKGMWMGGTVPLGYDLHPDPGVRSLKVNPNEAETVRRLFELYEELKCVSKLIGQAAIEDLRSKPRTMKDGSISGGRRLSRGQLYYLLRNPLYIGKVRHKGKTYDGQHEAVVDLDLWNRVQELLASNAARKRDTGVEASRSFVEISPLAGKLYDETGDRLTPSHTNKGSKRHRYYVSHRLVRTSRDRNDKSGWRLPAGLLEKQVATLIAEWIVGMALQHRLLAVPQAAEELALIERARTIKSGINEHGVKAAVPLIDRCTIAPGSLGIVLDRSRLAAALSVAPESLVEYALTFDSDFQLRRRGVETKIVSGVRTVEYDKRLIEVLAKAHDWFERVLQGESIADIARHDGHAKYYVGSRIQLAFLSPILQRRILDGTQGVAMTIENLVGTEFPLDWREQERLYLADDRAFADPSTI